MVPMLVFSSLDAKATPNAALLATCLLSNQVPNTLLVLVALYQKLFALVASQQYIFFLDNNAAMKFIKSTLPDNETIEMEISFHWTHVLIAWLYLIFLGWLVIGIFLFVSMYIEKWTTERALTNRRLVIAVWLDTKAD